MVTVVPAVTSLVVMTAPVSMADVPAVMLPVVSDPAVLALTLVPALTVPPATVVNAAIVVVVPDVRLLKRNGPKLLFDAMLIARPALARSIIAPPRSKFTLKSVPAVAVPRVTASALTVIEPSVATLCVMLADTPPSTNIAPRSAVSALAVTPAARVPPVGRSVILSTARAVPTLIVPPLVTISMLLGSAG